MNNKFCLIILFLFFIPCIYTRPRVKSESFFAVRTRR